MEQRVFEGQWEEIARRGEELAGHRVRLTVLDEPEAPRTPGRSAEAKAVLEDLIDHEAIASCAREVEGKAGPSIEEVRTALGETPRLDGAGRHRGAGRPILNPGSLWGHPGPDMEGFKIMDIALADDLRRLLRKKVESGQFPSEEAVVNAALRRFLAEESATPPGDATEPREGRLPGPFLEDEAVLAPSDLPRPGQVVACTFLRDEARSPDLFPGE